MEAIKVCVAGGGFGGLYTALSLSKFSWVKTGRCRITLIEPKDRFLFSPLLYEILTAELQPWEIAPSYQKLLATTKIEFCQDWVQEINLDSRRVTLQQGNCLTYDYLVLAVGGKTRVANIPGINYALSFRSLVDAELLQEKLIILEGSERQRLRIAIIGGGANGVELACKLSDRLHRRSKIFLLERGSEILKGFSSGVKTASERALKTRHVEIMLYSAVKAIEADKITLMHQERVMELDVDLVIWAAGMESWELVRNLPCQQNAQGKLLTYPSLQLIDYPEVFALGDLAHISNKKQLIPATAQAAYQQASCAAKNIQASLKGKKLQSFFYWHLGDMLTLGKKEAIVSSFFLNISGKLGGLIRRLVYIQRLPTLRHRLQVMKNFLKFRKKKIPPAHLN